MKFVLILFHFIASVFSFRKIISGFKRRIVIVNLLNHGILFLNRKTRS